MLFGWGRGGEGGGGKGAHAPSAGGESVHMQADF